MKQLNISKLNNNPLIGWVIFFALFCAQIVYAQQEVWIDVRTVAEYSEAHMQGAENIPHNEIGERIAALVSDKDTKIQLYCRSGNRAGKALKVLQEMGYTNLHNQGGLSDVRKLEGVKIIE